MTGERGSECMGRYTLQYTHCLMQCNHVYRHSLWHYNTHCMSPATPLIPRLALDLSTDRTLKEARFDRHFVRDLVWSRHQLEELAERRFRAAQVRAFEADKAE